MTDDDVRLLELLDLSLQPLQSRLDYWIEVSPVMLLTRLLLNIYRSMLRLYLVLRGQGVTVCESVQTLNIIVLGVSDGV